MHDTVLIGMDAAFLEAQFRARIVSVTGDLQKLPPLDGVEAMVAFYRDERIDGCDIGQDGDTLLYEWGTWDWGDGLAFELDVTRQVIVGAGEDDDIQQLHLTFRYPSAVTGDGVGAGDTWCASPDGIDEFRAFVLSSPVLHAAAGHRPTSVVIRMEGV